MNCVPKGYTRQKPAKECQRTNQLRQELDAAVFPLEAWVFETLAVIPVGTSTVYRALTAGLGRHLSDEHLAYTRQYLHYNSRQARLATCSICEQQRQAGVLVDGTPTPQCYSQPMPGRGWLTDDAVHVETGSFQAPR